LGDFEECGFAWPCPFVVAVGDALALADGDAVGLGVAVGVADRVPDGGVPTDWLGAAPPAGAVPPAPLDVLGAPDLTLPPVTPKSPPCAARDADACGTAHWVNGAFGPPVTAMATAARKATSTAIEPIPANRSNRCRRPDGSAKTGLGSTAGIVVIPARHRPENGPIHSLS
jgi:hypothetical protein